jgi:hypothetical protein
VLVYAGATLVCLTALTTPALGFVSAIDSGQPDRRVAGEFRRSRESVRKGRIGMSDFRRAPLHEMTRDLAASARGDLPATLVIRGGTLVSVTSGEILPNMSVAVQGPRIAYVGSDASHTGMRPASSRPRGAT